MEFSPAPLYQDVAGGPPGGAAHWLRTDDGIRIRVGHWWPEGTARGTVFLFPGRTEYVEKYGDAAREFTRRGLAMLAVDWRGQGLADRLLADRRLGHVARFTDYQRDVAAVVALAATLDLPRPWFVIGHSMGGAIGLRAVIEGLPVAACSFTGPMWGIFFTPVMKPLSWLTSNLAPALGLGHRNPATTSPEPYVILQPFEGNSLTRDQAMYQMMRDQLAAYPDLSLGAPTNIWLREALAECRKLADHSAPDLPCLTYLGSNEQIVDRKAIRTRMAAWPRGELVEIPGGEHEVLMESPAVRGPVYDRLAAHFLAAT
ncbi:alpha/beta fold hydrolase [Ruegeria marina]|uniref:Lysophospholipase n=1 Tax=Ruegeria marina TaxID=639004 RepID=A0A1G6Z396_9RHOB|nr:alpha/beta hydrolase [Ruegeria marina]SDD96325.1 lysophospholipase [Ruegeria marina]